VDQQEEEEVENKEQWVEDKEDWVKNTTIQRRREETKRGSWGKEEDEYKTQANFQMITDETQTAITGCKLSLQLCSGVLKLD
jgi:hypothetical protein